MSLSRRLLVAASAVLFVFLGLTGLVLDRAFQSNAEQAQRDRLQSQIYALLATADFVEIDQRLQLGDALPEPRLGTPLSGLYAVIYKNVKGRVWKSPSSVGLSIPRYTQAKRAQWFFEKLVTKNGQQYFSQNFSVVWEDHLNKQFEYVFQVLEDYDVYNQQVSSFRRELWGWLVAVAAVLLLAQGFILRWSLKPLRKVASDIEAVKSGTTDRLKENYPEEIQGLTQGINTFIDSERAQRDRYRRTLADLAHSLKTPLAVLKSGLHNQGQNNVMDDQIDRMRDIVDYQLQRASSAGRTTMGVHTELLPVIERIVGSLKKVHADKNIQCTVKVDSELKFPGEQGDLMELVGNLLENAYKWACQEILVNARLENNNRLLQITVEDDGAGIPDNRKQEVLLRGRRADETVAGHGIGLSIVQEIVSQYGGSIQLDDSPLGGASIGLSIPLE